VFYLRMFAASFDSSKMSGFRTEKPSSLHS
jgi:hypothetical protein